MQRLMDDTADERSPGWLRRALIVFVAVVATLGAFGIAYALGTLAYWMRIQASHDARVSRLLPQQPALEQIVEGLAAEGTALLASPASVQEVQQTADRWGKRRRAEVLAKAARWPMIRVFDAKQMVYFVYFDRTGVMRDFVCVRQ
jgi:hypothetical protein